MPKLIGHKAHRDLFMDPGPLGSAVDAFARDLTSLGYTQLTVINYADAARHFAAWLRRTNIVLACVDGAVVDQFARHVAAAVAADDVNGSPAAM